MTALFATVVVVAAVVLIARGAEIRLVLLGAGLAMATIAGRPLAIADAFGRSMVAAMVAPICASMGFAAVLKETGCDRQLVNLLLRPIRRWRWVAVPGGILSAYVVNLAVPSQASTAAMLGPILLPILIATGLAPEVAGAALVLGASFGGDLLNPGSQDVQALAGVTGIAGHDLSRKIIPASLAGMAAATVCFAVLHRPPRQTRPVDPHPPDEAEPVHFAKAMIPLIPVTMLLIAYTGWRPLAWLLDTGADNPRPDMATALPVVRAMLIGCVVAAIVGWRRLRGIVGRLFEGMGTAYRDIISLTISAQCFGAGLAAAGVGDALLHLVGKSRWALAAMSVSFPWGLAALSGSGSGPVLAFAEAVLVNLTASDDEAGLGAMSCLAAAFGRTVSPVSAVVICGAGLAGVTPLRMIRTMVPSVVVGAVVALGIVWIRFGS